MNKRIGIALVVMFIMGIIWGNLERAPEQQSGKENIKIGVALPLTGNAAISGDSHKAIMTMAMNKIEAMDTKYDYEFIIEDNKLEPKTMAKIINKFVNIDNVSAVLSTFVMSHKITKDYADDGKVINMGCSWGETIGEGLYNFNTYTSTVISVDRMTREFIKDGVKNIGVLTTISPGTEAMRNTMVDKLNELDINIVFNEQFNRGEVDFKMLISKLKNKEIDTLFLAVYPFEGERIFCELLTQGVDVPVTAVDVLTSFEDKRLLEGKKFISFAITDDDFTAEYESITDVDMGVCGAQLYNGTMVLVEGFENAKSTNIKDVSEYINAMGTFDGASGTIKITDTNFNQVNVPLVTMKNGQLELIEE